MYKWNNDWRDELKKTNEGCYIRLCECRNTRNDIIIMAKLVKKYNPTGIPAAVAPSTFFLKYKSSTKVPV